MTLKPWKVQQITLLCPGRTFVFWGGWRVVFFSFFQVGLCEFHFGTHFGWGGKRVEICMVSFSPEKNLGLEINLLV